MRQADGGGMVGWGERRAFLLEEARRDLEAGEEVQPCLLAWHGDEPLLIAYLRSYRRGEHLEALLEVLGLAAPLGADRLALVLSGRAWSLHDPIPPVDPTHGDLRQRVVVIEQADGTNGPVRMDTTAIPFTLHEDALTWLPPIENTDTISRVATALAAAIHHRAKFPTGATHLRHLAEHYTDQGHLIALAKPVYDRLIGSGGGAVRPA